MDHLFETRPMAQAVSESEELRHFKAVVKSLMNQAQSLLGDLELSAHGENIEEKIAALDHCVDFTRRLCEQDPSAS